MFDLEVEVIADMKHLYEILRTCSKKEEVKDEFFKMRIFALFSSIAVFLATLASAADIRPVLPPVQHLDTEVVTNVVVSAQGSHRETQKIAPIARLQVRGRYDMLSA